MKAQDRGAIKRIMAFSKATKEQEAMVPPSAGPCDADGPLPFGGDLQAAMKAQDRGAIKQMMKHATGGGPGAVER
jgi:hypothetical protein